MSDPYLPEILELRRMRKVIGLTQDELAQRAGLSQSMIAKIEIGSLNPTYEVVRKIYHILKSFEQDDQSRAHEVMSPVISVEAGDSINQVLNLMKERGISQVPVLSKNGRNLGSITEETLLELLLKGEKLSDIANNPVEDIMEDIFPVINQKVPLNAIISLLQYSPAVLVKIKGQIRGIITKADLLKGTGRKTKRT
ncbi:MAG: CBS domain-containing protein [Candidatus Kariarchaeaceae archaeon]|jgi:predicted transcriptional regulator